MAAIDPDSPRYARQRVLPGWGAAAQRRLADARVVVLGAGGLGSAVVPALVAAGVGTIVVVDHEVGADQELIGDGFVESDRRGDEVRVG